MVEFQITGRDILFFTLGALTVFFLGTHTGRELARAITEFGAKRVQLLAERIATI